MDISLVGSINIDLVYRVPYVVKNGETLHSASHSVHFGGKGANQAVTASQLGANVHFIGKVGADDFGGQAINNLKEKGVYTDSVQKEGATGQAIIQVTDAGDNAIVLFPGANFLVTPEQIEQEADIISSSNALLLQLEVPLEAVEKAVEIAAEHGQMVILNPAPSQKLPDSLLKNVTFLTPNETELAQLTGIETTSEENIRAACSLLLDKGVGTVVVTLGSKGSFYMNREESGWVQALSVNTIDTTGAGDAFNGALAVGLCSGDSLRSAIEFATKVAAYVVTQMGAQPLIPHSYLE
ncbi:ribokinase [Lederbergia wuyishanensis]|uniref:Ribokinase n=1 Tax=Lederbergia wuyishanensis TaxID=1347903 RepID=A0ABU0CYU4_9BACI|nr:ribokinase [Lederbergia wuyishanensis]MCJ8005961.1 ribokinase [Lederbergia wuyishanensis]MDQ0341326.1 ribokinase [Lederbergia wuyishanensis]